MTTDHPPTDHVPTDPALAIATGPPSLRTRLDHGLVVTVFSIAIFGDVLAFNQLATQSPIDGNLMVLVLVVGLAGALEGIRRVALGGDATARIIGVVLVVLAVIAFLAWSVPWITEFQGLVVIAAAVVIGLLSTSLLWRQRHDASSDATQFAGLLALAQAIVAMWFGVLAITTLGS